MPEANKLEAMVDAGYRVAHSCATCRHAKMFNSTPWGHCMKTSYVHTKHQAKRQTPSCLWMFCKEWELDEAILDHMKGYLETLTFGSLK